MIHSLQLGAKLMFLTVCLFVAFGGHYPPAYSQLSTSRYRVQPIPVITAEDEMQDHDIDLVNKHLEATDARVQEQWKTIQKNALDISGMQGEERIIGGVLALLSSAGIILQVRRKAV